MPKVQNPQKIARAKELLSKKVPFTQARQILQKEFGQGLSMSTLAELNQSLTPNSGEQSKNVAVITPDIKNAIQKVVLLFNNAIKIPKFLDLVNEEQMKAIKDLQGAIKNE